MRCSTATTKIEEHVGQGGGECRVLRTVSPATWEALGSTVHGDLVRALPAGSPSVRGVGEKDA